MTSSRLRPTPPGSARPSQSVKALHNEIQWKRYENRYEKLRLIFDLFGLRPSRKLTASQRMTVSVWWSSAKNGRTRLESWQPEFVWKSLPESSYWSRIGRLSLCRMSANARRTWFKAWNKFELWSHGHFCRMNCVCRRITRGKLRQADAQCSKCTCTRHQTGFRWLHIDADCWNWQSGCKWYSFRLPLKHLLKLHEATWSRHIHFHSFGRNNTALRRNEPWVWRWVHDWSRKYC